MAANLFGSDRLDLQATKSLELAVDIVKERRSTGGGSKRKWDAEETFGSVNGDLKHSLARDVDPSRY